MSSDVPKLNPYQPPLSVPGKLDLEAPTEVTFHLTHSLDRHAEAQYLLHWHPQRLLLGSLAMIAASVAIVMFSVTIAFASLLPAMVFVLAGSAAVYSALVHRTKRKIRVRQKEYGLIPDEMITLLSDTQRINVVTPGGTHTWPNRGLEIFRAPRGLLICPEPLLYVFVPKQSSFQLESYRQFVNLIESRAA